VVDIVDIKNPIAVWPENIRVAWFRLRLRLRLRLRFGLRLGLRRGTKMTAPAALPRVVRV
jgi:hypothetical protein